MTGPDADALDAKLIAAHRRGDDAALVTLYREAGEAAQAEGDIDRACFFYVHAYVFALESGHTDAGWLRARLKHFGREK